MPARSEGDAAPRSAVTGGSPLLGGRLTEIGPAVGRRGLRGFRGRESDGVSGGPWRKRDAAVFVPETAEAPRTDSRELHTWGRGSRRAKRGRGISVHFRKTEMRC